MSTPKDAKPPSKHPDSDPALLAKAIDGDRAALAQILASSGPVVRSRIAPKIGAPWQAMIEPDDVMQVTYLEAFLRIERFTDRGPGSFVAWLTQIAENNLRDAIKELERMKRPSPRKQVRPSGGADGDSYMALVEILGVTITTPSVHAARGEVQNALDAALKKLPPDYERVIHYYDLQGLAAAQVGEKLGKSPGAVYMLLARAHDRLKDVLGTESQFFSQTS
jgi:RNA polymerase sigma-70 factor (ECF subfamily)